MRFATITTLALLASPAMADGMASPRIDPAVTKPVCAYQFLFWKWEGDCRASRVSNRDGDDPNTPGPVGSPDDPDPKPTVDRSVKSDNSDANGKGGNRHNRTDKDKHSQEIAERKKGWTE